MACVSVTLIGRDAGRRGGILQKTVRLEKTRLSRLIPRSAARGL